MKRLHNLDYLRGLAAFSIMIYHYTGDFFYKPDAGTTLGRLGIYGVSIFYILSGLTLYTVYQKSFIPTTTQVKEFALKRVFRIFPLLWLVIAAVIILSRKMPPIDTLALNLTGLFGFVKWDDYIARGAWSIGNELVFYVFFPVFILLIRKSKAFFLTFTGLLLAIYVYFAFYLLSPLGTLSDQWQDYVNPLNQVFLFTAGVLMGFLFKNLRINNVTIFLLFISSIAAFVLYPASGNTIHIVTGWSRLAFTLIMFLICFCFYKMEYELPAFLHRPLSVLGEASYSVYLMHPIIGSGILIALRLTGIKLPTVVVFLICIVATIMVSYLIYQYFEKYFIKVGRKVISNVPVKLTENETKTKSERQKSLIE